MLEEELQLQADLEVLKELVYKQKDFTVYRAFETLARGKQAVEERDLIDFMKKHGKFIGDNDIDAVLRRVDVEGDGVISYNEFLEFIIPFNIPEKETSLDLPMKKDGGISADFMDLELSAENRMMEKHSREGSEEIKVVENEEDEEHGKEDIEEEIGDKRGKDVRLSELLLEVFLAVRSEEIRKQELTMIADFSIQGVMELVGNGDEISIQELSKFLVIPRDEAMILFKDSRSINSGLLEKILSPRDDRYKIAVGSGPFPSHLVNLLKTVLNSIVSAERVIVSLHKYQHSSLAATRGQSNLGLSAEQIDNIFAELGIKVPSEDALFLISRLES